MGQFTGAWYGLYRGVPDQETLDTFKGFLKELEDIIQENGNKFSQAGDNPGAVDFLIWPWFERIGALKLLNPGESVVSPPHFFPPFPLFPTPPLPSHSPSEPF